MLSQLIGDRGCGFNTSHGRKSKCQDAGDTAQPVLGALTLLQPGTYCRTENAMG